MSRASFISYPFLPEDEAIGQGDGPSPEGESYGSK